MIRFEGIEKELQQPSNKNAKIEDTFKLKHKGNRIQLEFNQKILKIVENLSSALNNDDTSEANGLCDDLTAKLKRRNKLIKMADRSVLGWDTVAQYEADTIASDSDGGKKIRKANRTGYLPKGKLKHLTNLPFAFPVRNLQASSYGSTVNITASHPRVNETSTSDFHRTVLPRTSTIDARNGPIAQMSDRGTRALAVVKEDTGANTARTPGTETKIEGMKIDNEFSNLNNDYTIQEFEFERGNNYPFVKGRLKKNLIFW